MDREWKTKRQKLMLFSYESKTLFIVFQQTGSIIILNSSFFTLHFI